MTYEEITNKNPLDAVKDGVFFAFNKEQFKEGLSKINATIENIVSIGAGGYLLKAEVNNFKQALKKSSKELADFLKTPENLLEALIYELNNHEYCYTGDPQDALDVLGLDFEDISPDIWFKAHNATKDEQ